MREELLTRMIHLYGFEHPAVVQFASLMESEMVDDETLRIIVESHEEFGIAFDWEEEF